MLKFKQSPEDFKVTEIINLDDRLDPKGDYIYFWLTKKGYNTVQILKKLGKFCIVKGGRIGFAGAKDKQAVTKQAISIRDPDQRLHKDVFNNFNSDRIQLEFIGRGKTPISLGDNKGNRFEIFVESDKPPKHIKHMINYFDDQRFSINNHQVGKAMVMKDWKKACGIIIEESVQKHLRTTPTDFLGALRTVPLKTLLMYVHSYQSLIWNNTAKKIIYNQYKDFETITYTLGTLPTLSDIKPEHKDLMIPIVGFGTELSREEPCTVIKEILVEEDVKQRDFIIHQFPELSADGGERPFSVEIKDLKIEELGKNNYQLSFFLPKGAYATMALKHIFI